MTTTAPSVPTKLEIIEMSQNEFEALLEYSTSLPTGTTIGKQWKRHLFAGPNKGEWWLGEYVDNQDDPKWVGIKWRRIKVPLVQRITALAAEAEARARRHENADHSRMAREMREFAQALRDAIADEEA